MDLGLADKAVVITGGSKGIGRAAALAFADEGAHVAICARGKPALEATAGELRARGTKVFAQAADVSRPDELDAFLEAARAALGRVDVLVNNTSGFGTSDDEKGWKASFDVDVMASVRATWKVVPWLAEQGGGVVLHISSTSALEAGSPPPYAAAKAALISHSKTLAVALAPKKIRVNVIAPGSIEFPGGVWEMIKKANRPFYDAIQASIPWGRLGSAEEVANAIVFAASPRASWITGVVLSVDGGQHKGNL
ncbi:MAG TPA: SDR family oxidoreductase [Myxococcota bacterium]|nr:SDR family oxidoreductase [Myxococcota bacterium]